jgi:DNA-binding beta-propeller fold protein YncE
VSAVGLCGGSILAGAGTAAAIAPGVVAPHVVATIAAHAREMAVDPSTHRLFFTYGEDMSVIDESGDADNDKVVATVALGFTPYAIAVDPSTHRVFVAGGDQNGTVAVIDESGDADNNHVIATLDVNSYPDSIAVDPSNHAVYVNGVIMNTPYGNIGTIAVINGAAVASAIKVTDTIPFYGHTPSSLAVDPSDHHVYALEGSPDGGGLVVLDESSGKLIGGLSLSEEEGDPVVDPSTHDVYLIQFDEQTILKIDESGDATNDQLIGTSGPIGTNPQAMAVDPLTHTLYVTGSDESQRGTVSVIDESGDTGTAPVTATVAVGRSPGAVVVDPSNGNVYVANGDGTISVVGSDQADLALTVTGPSVAANRSTIAETVTVTNHGPSSASGITTELFVPADFTVRSAPGSSPAGTEHGVLIWSDQTLAPGAHVTHVVTATVDSNLPAVQTIGGIVLSALADPNLANNAAVANVRIG